MNIKNYVFSTLLLISSLAAETIGIIGGRSSGNDNYAAFVTSESTTVVPTSSLPVTSSALKVAINKYGQALMGGRTTAPALYAAFVSPDLLTPLVISNVPTGNNSFLNSVVINDSGQGLIGGSNLNTPYAAWVTFGSSTATTISASFPSGAGTIDSVTLNASGRGLMGGGVNNLQDAYAARIVLNSPTVAEITGLPIGGSSVIYSVALNGADQGLIGGVNNGNAYAAFIAPNSTVSIPINSLPSGGSAIGNAAFEGQGVALNNSGKGLIVGHNQANAYAAWVSFNSTTPTPITSLPIGGNSVILTAALNDSGIGLIGGQDKSTGTAVAYAAWVFSGSSTPIPITNLPPTGTIYSVSVNQFGQGLIGGINNTNAYAALLAPSSTQPVPLMGIPTGGGTTLIDSVALILSSLAIPTESLTGNNLILANYINQNAPQTVFYFIPSIFNDTLNSALESVAPTRNAIPTFSADNTLFSLNTAFSLHSQASRWFQCTNDSLHSCICSDAQSEEWNSPDSQECPYQMWGELIGVFAHQGSQHQTPGFKPLSGGFIVALDTKVTTEGRFGAGAAYTYTHVHEKYDAGHSNINQGYLFLYGLWNNSQFYFDGALWAGLFHAKNLRKIHMTGFDFQAQSHPKGWQLAPHAEFGYDYTLKRSTMEPFMMFDWINNWQQSYQEVGNGPFNFSQKDHHSSFLRSEFGLRFYETINCFSYRLKVSYVNRKLFGIGDIIASLIGAPGSFTVKTFTTQNLGVIGLGILFEPSNSHYPYGTIDYQGEFGTKFQSHLLALGISWNF